MSVTEKTPSFSELFDQSLINTDMQPGAIVKATVVAIDPKTIVVNAGLKSESYISIDEFRNQRGEVDVNIGDEIDVIVEAVENGFGETRLSREKARRAEAWAALDHAYESKETVVGVVSERVKGGFIVLVNSIRAFLPGSLVDVRPVRDPEGLEGKELEFKLIKMDQKRNNIVVSRRAVVEEETSAERLAFLDELQEGQEVMGVVKNITDYGAFIDLGGLDGLLHITDIAWKRVKHPSEVLNVGDEIKVRILKFDRERQRVSLGIKQLGEDPWVDVIRRYPVGSRLFGHVTNITDYGCFVEIEDGIEGLVHMSEMDWTNKNIHPSKIVQLGDEVEVKVLEIDENRRRISLGIKQCQPNPWDDFTQAHQVGEKIKGPIRSVTDFGIFVGLEGEIDGLVHLTDVSWFESSEETLKKYKKGDELETVILAIDSDRERISLGIKQLEDNPMAVYMNEHPQGSVVSGKVQQVDARNALVTLGEDIVGQISANEVAAERVQDVRDYLSEGEEIEAKLLGYDRKQKRLTLSIKALHKAQLDESTEQAPKSTLGDIFKAKIDDER